MTRTTLARLRIPVVMSDILPVIAILALLLGGALYVARKQARDYKAYLTQHTAETARQTEAQRELITQQVAAADRQTEVLNRIAEALERRG
jgi:uncharacterized protein YxeA